MARLQKLLFLLVLVWLLPAGPVQAREIRVGVYQNEPKVFTDASGKPAGILIELLGEIAAREGWQLQFVNCTWAACLDQLAAGGIDLMPDVAYSDERARRFDFHPTPALYSWSQLYQRKGVNIFSPLDLQGKRLVVLAGSLQQSGVQTLLDAYGVRAEVATADTLRKPSARCSAVRRMRSPPTISMATSARTNSRCTSRRWCSSPRGCITP